MSEADDDVADSGVPELHAIRMAAIDLVKAKLRYKGHRMTMGYHNSWTKAEVALYEAVKPYL